MTLRSDQTNTVPPFFTMLLQLFIRAPPSSEGHFCEAPEMAFVNCAPCHKVTSVSEPQRPQLNGTKRTHGGGGGDHARGGIGGRTAGQFNNSIKRVASHQDKSGGPKFQSPQPAICCAFTRGAAAAAPCPRRYRRDDLRANFDTSKTCCL